ncbi:MAG: pyruvate dehydrogenase [Candidatus Aminicenantes bacterium]|nr:pyruvate dehydrogenase [Candidatus Aminicenantes bacterium]
MKTIKFADAIDRALGQEMAKDKDIIIMGEDVHMLRVNLYTRFGKDRVRPTPISESAFLGAAVTAAMAGLRPVVEVMLVDFIGVAMDALLNHVAKTDFFSGGKWNVPLVVRTSCGGGYGDGGQHEQSLWGWLAHIPGISVVVPSNPADAGSLMLTAVRHDHPVIYLEHKLLSGLWLDYMGIGGRKSVTFDVPEAGAEGKAGRRWKPLPYGELNMVKQGDDITLASVGVGVHRCIEAAKILAVSGISSEVLDLRWVAPLDEEGLKESVRKTGIVLVVDEDYKGFGLSGEISAVLLEQGLSFKFARVCTDSSIPFSRSLEDQALPNVARIVETALRLLKK